MNSKNFFTVGASQIGKVKRRLLRARQGFGLNFTLRGAVCSPRRSSVHANQDGDCKIGTLHRLQSRKEAELQAVYRDRRIDLEQRSLTWRAVDAKLVKSHI